jgi:hypothetical protein
MHDAQELEHVAYLGGGAQAESRESACRSHRADEHTLRLQHAVARRSIGR